MLTMDEARARVARGAAHLDRVRPGWFNRIDVGTLTLHDPCGCVVGQLAPAAVRSRYWDDAQLWALELLPRGVHSNDPAYDPIYERLVIEHGFDLTYGEAPDARSSDSERRRIYQPLQDAWIEAIADRVLCSQQAHEPDQTADAVARDSQVTASISIREWMS